MAFPNPLPKALPLFLLLCCLPSGSRAAELVRAERENRLKAGMALVIEVPLDSQAVIAGGFPIDSTGFADLPVVGRVFVHDRKQVEVEEYLSGRLVDYLKDTYVRVVPAIRLAMLGHWEKPGMYYLDPKGTVWEGLKAAGGPAGEKNLHELRVLRAGQELDINVLAALSQGLSLEAAGIRSGDVLTIPVPDERDAWFWFRESVDVVGDLIGIVGTVVTLYLTTEFILERNR